MRPETAIALAMLFLRWKRGNALGYRTDIVGQLQRMKDGGLDLVGVRIRSVPGGLSSEEVSNFVGRMATTGHIVQESPINLTDDGFQVLRNHLSSKYEEPAARDEILRAASVLGLPTTELRQLVGRTAMVA